MSERQDERENADVGSSPLRRRGYYWDALSPEMQSVYPEADVDGLGNEIALLRMMITTTLSRSPCDCGLLARELRTLARLERTNAYLHRPTRKKKVDVSEAVDKFIARLMSRNNPGNA